MLIAITVIRFLATNMAIKSWQEKLQREEF